MLLGARICQRKRSKFGFANRAIDYLPNCENEKLPREIMVAFE